MPGDYTRKIFDEKKHYSGVLMQQGRVQLDADWNEQLDIQQYRETTEAKDVIGICGAPKKNGGFQIIVNTESFIISPGRIYINGLLFELEALQVPTTYFNQPYFPNPDLFWFNLSSPPSSPLDSPPASPPSAPGLQQGTYIVYLEGWQREINFRDDALIQEKALGEADTTTRLKNVWQVKLLKIKDDGTANCETDFPEWDKLIMPVSGKLNAKTVSNNDPKEPCVLPPSSGYRRLENQLYRVQIHDGGDHNTATFKWSRDNATVETSIENISGHVLTVSDMGKDEVLGFAAGQWVEIVDEISTLHSKPYPLLQIDAVSPEFNEITLHEPVDFLAGNPGLKLRRWDQAGAGTSGVGIPLNPGWVNLEDGIQIEFTTGTYHSGDYWLIPARTATGEIEWPPFAIPNLAPQMQSPIGIQRNYCKLAILQVQHNLSSATDCRMLFPSLTDICAEDICFDNDTCDLAGAKTMQEALDLLCAANDLRKHNKLLHGYGVICGLKVICGLPDNFSDGRGRVLIETGHALDCDGNIIQVKNGGISYDVVTEAAANGLLDKGNGTVCLKIARAGNKPSMISIEKFEKQDFWDEILEGSLIKDFYTSCIEKLIIFFKDQLPFPITDEVPVPVKQRRLTAILNLFSQLINSKSGPYGFISGKGASHIRSKDCGENSNEKIYEDNLLYCLYEMIKDQLASETYCAMFDYDHFPKYNVDEGLETIFGTPLKFHLKLKIDASGTYGYTCGMNNKVYVYDLKKQELIQSVAFPANAQIKIQDLVIFKESVYAVGLLDDKDSEFALGNIVNGMITWKGTSVNCGIRFVSMAITDNGILYAIAKRSGLYQVSGITQPNFTAVQKKAASATGLLALSADGNTIYYSETIPAATNPSSFTQVTGWNIAANSISTFLVKGNDPGNDMIVSRDLVFISGVDNINPSQRVVKMFNLAGVLIRDILIENSSFVHLAIDPQRNNLLISLSDLSKVVCVNLSGSFQVKKGFRIPVQTYAMSIAINSSTGKSYVLNSFVNTITAIDLDKVFNTAAVPNFTFEPPEDLRNYRTEVVKAYQHLFGHLLQSLKDCFCDKFLVDCPTCNEKNKVYLGCVEIRDGKVYHICNFTKRQYVKTFPTVEYWLSTIPVLPMFKKAFNMFCCAIIDK